MKLKWVLMVILILGSVHGSAQQATRAELDEVVKKVEKIRTALKISASECDIYNPKSSISCTFESYCSEFSTKAQDFYLYQDREGRQVPNFQMMAYLNFAEACAGNSFPQAAVQDPFVYPKLLFNEELAGGRKQLRENQARVQKEITRTQKIFTEAKDKVIQFLSKKKTSANAMAIDNMISRIRVVNLKTPPLTGTYADLAEFGCESPNAYFDDTNNTIKVCPQLANLPEAALFSTLVHEFGHAIDSCSMSFGVSETGRILPEWMGYGVGPEPVKIPSVSFTQNPFKSIVNCLQSPESIAVEVPTKKELLKKLDDELEAVKMIYEEASIPGEEKYTDVSENNFNDQKDQIEKNYESFKYCRSFSGSGHMQEAFSDWVSAQVIAEKLATIPDRGKAQEYAFGSQAVFFGTSCGNIGQLTASKIASTLGKACPQLRDLESLASSSDALTEITHPKTSRRINRVIYAQPATQKALGCKPLDNGKECK